MKVLKNLKILQINARSLSPRRVEISKLVVEKNIDVLVVLESWLSVNSDRPPPAISGLVVANLKNRDESYKYGRGGGVIIYVNPKRISFSAVDLVKPAPHGVDICCIKIHTANTQLLDSNWMQICAVYVPPDLSGKEWWHSIPKAETVLCADVNTCGSWSSFGSPTNAGGDIDTWLVSRGMIVANEPLMATRICPSSGTLSSPDLTAIPGKCAASAIWITGEDIGSDHLPILLSFHNIQVTERRETKWSFKKAKWSTFQSVLDSEISNRSPSEDPNTAASMLNTAIQTALKASVPRGCRKKSFFWWSNDVEAAVAGRRKALKTMQGDNTPEHRLQYQLACEEASRAIQEAKREAWRTYCESLNGDRPVKDVWRTIANLSGKHSPPKSASPLVLNGKTYISEQSKAKAFNNHQTRSQHKSEQNRTAEERLHARSQARSTSVRARRRSSYLNRETPPTLNLLGTKIDVKIQCQDLDSQWYRGTVVRHLLSQGTGLVVLVKWDNGDPDETLNLAREDWKPVDDTDDDRFDFEAEFTTTEVHRVIRSMACEKAGGPDDIPLQALPHLTDAAIHELTRVVNLSWKSGQCPTLWKTSRLIPVPKAKPGAYRPISLTNAIGRIADKLITRRLTHFLEMFQLIPGEQAGFRRAMSAELQSCAFVEWVAQKQQLGESVNCVFLDASAAYDFVNHDILMSRLGSLNPPARLTRWINSFIRGRVIDTKWGSTTSSKRTSHRGVPQGASMSPILWLLYTASIFDDLHLPSLTKHRADFMPFLYADDIALAVSSKSSASLQIVMQELLDHVADFCRISCITLNASKSVQVVISTSHSKRQTKIPQHLASSTIPADDSARFLGILINSSMNFTDQCLAARRRMEQRLRIVQATSGKHWGLDQQRTFRLVNQFVFSSGLYGAPAYYGLSTQAGQSHLQTAYNQCLRVITGCTRTTPIPALHTAAGAPLLETRIARQASCLANTARRHNHPTPANLVLSTPMPQNRIRLNKKSWRQLAEENLPSSIPLAMFPPRPAPWVSTANVAVHYSSCNRNDPPTIRRTAALECIDAVKRQCTSPAMQHGVEIDAGYAPAGAPSSSLAAEILAAVNGIASVTSRLAPPFALPDVLLVTDSMSLVSGLGSDPYTMSPDMVPVHHSITNLAQLAAAKVLVRDRTRYPPPLVHAKHLDGETDRRTTSLLNQLSTGHCSLLQSYLYKINVVESPICLLCEAEPDTADHLLLIRVLLELQAARH